MAILLTTDGKWAEHKLALPEAKFLAEVQQLIGGYVEPHYFHLGPVGARRPMVALLNEDGRLLSLPMNSAATFLLGFPVFGPALICTEIELQ